MTELERDEQEQDCDGDGAANLRELIEARFFRRTLLIWALGYTAVMRTAGVRATRSDKMPTLAPMSRNEVPAPITQCAENRTNGFDGFK